ncbi:hypothetical protein AB0F07_18000 [Streptomyces fructofermentans]|uniref:hypothetical protein n=1 Tax=Streptomyces fructofermentans TaxID=152141 RepID=UPI0033F9BCB9
MRNGGDGHGHDSGGGATDERSGRPGGLAGALARRVRRHRGLAAAALITAVAAGISLPLALADSSSDKPCWTLTAGRRALADDTAAATRALDPGEDLQRLGTVRKLLAHEKVCGDGARALGRLVAAATGSEAGRTGTPHTLAQARAAYGVAAALHGVEIPAGLAPGVARMLAEYVVDAGRDDRLRDDGVNRPALPAEEAAPDEDGYSPLGRFLAPGEAHAVFGHADAVAEAEADIEGLVAELAEDPEAFAILYDAERAHLAYYLERLTDRGGDPDFRPSADKRFTTTPQDWPDHDLHDIAGRVGTLMKFRARHIREGTIADPAAFDKAVRAHTRGAFRPAARQLRSRPPMGDIADRPTAGPVRGDLLDGRHQLTEALDEWAGHRDVPDERLGAMRQLLDNWYVRALWLR